MALTAQSFISTATKPAFPLAVRGEGAYIFDKDGNKYLDGSSGAVVTALGHSHPRVLAAMRAQLEKITFAYGRVWENRPDEELAGRVAALCGGNFDSAFFLSSGSEATEAALKFARQLAVAREQSERYKVISRTPSYHGATLGALSVTGDPVMEGLFGPLMTPMPKIPAPMIYRVPAGYSADAYIDHCADALEEEIKQQGAETVLAFVVEPVGGTSTGALVSPARYYLRVREICDRYGVLLIHDEVMSGVGRSGAFLASHYWPGAAPDIVTLGKGLGAGYAPISALVTSSALVDEVRAMGGFAHGHTYVANPMSCAVGCAVLEELVDSALVEQSASMGLYLREQLEVVQKGRRSIGDIRGVGLQMAVEIVADKATKESYPFEVNAPAQIEWLMMERGLAMLHRRTGGGQFGEWFMICPPLISTRDEVDQLISILDGALEAFEGQSRQRARS